VSFKFVANFSLAFGLDGGVLPANNPFKTLWLLKVLGLKVDTIF